MLMGMNRRKSDASSRGTISKLMFVRWGNIATNKSSSYGKIYSPSFWCGSLHHTRFVTFLIKTGCWESIFFPLFYTIESSKMYLCYTFYETFLIYVWLTTHFIVLWFYLYIPNFKRYSFKQYKFFYLLQVIYQQLNDLNDKICYW